MNITRYNRAVPYVSYTYPYTPHSWVHHSDIQKPPLRTPYNAPVLLQLMSTLYMPASYYHPYSRRCHCVHSPCCCHLSSRTLIGPCYSAPLLPLWSAYLQMKLVRSRFLFLTGSEIFCNTWKTSSCFVNVNKHWIAFGCTIDWKINKKSRSRYTKDSELMRVKFYACFYQHCSSDIPDTSVELMCF